MCGKQASRLDFPQMLIRSGASACGARARRSYDRIMNNSPGPLAMPESRRQNTRRRSECRAAFGCATTRRVVRLDPAGPHRGDLLVCHVGADLPPCSA